MLLFCKFNKDILTKSEIDRRSIFHGAYIVDELIDKKRERLLADTNG